MREGTFQTNFFGDDASAEQVTAKSDVLQAIDVHDVELESHFKIKFQIGADLSRQVVSNQANKEQPKYRWYKYKEAFSVALIDYLLKKYSIHEGTVLDPFAGMGTTLHAAAERGLASIGIELLPIGQEIIKARMLLDKGLSESDVARLEFWLKKRPWTESKPTVALNELRITRDAYPNNTKRQIEQVLCSVENETDEIKTTLQFALLCILESISFTRKDGQYLRWDARSGRRQGLRPFNKGPIASFEEAFLGKIKEILDDTAYTNENRDLFHTNCIHADRQVISGSCLDVLGTLRASTYSAIITSPPYCNRYDYTRTYALELALLGLNEEAMLSLRQQMLTCTVENRAKDLVGMNKTWQKAVDIADSQQLLQTILHYLEHQKGVGLLNNQGIPRMVRGYFYEMSCVIQECFRILKPGSFMITVNDNVRYAGASISVDLILSNMAELHGFTVDSILVLPTGKGNSSQQMGDHGRRALRKCVYVWSKR